MTHDTETLKELFSEKFDLLDKYIDTRFSAQEVALGIAHRALEKRLDFMNEFREQLKDQAVTLITRNEVCLLIKSISDKQEEFSIYKATMEGKASQTSVIVAYIISVLSLILAIAGVTINISQ